MFKKLFQTNENHDVACEMSGRKVDIVNTVSLVRIHEIIIAKNIPNAIIDTNAKAIYAENKRPLHYYQEIIIPEEFRFMFGRLFVNIEDEDEIEASTAILSEHGINGFSFNSLQHIMPYLDKHVILKLPNTMFFAIVSREEQIHKKICENWNVEYSGYGKKYMSKKILDFKRDSQELGMLSILLPGWDVGFTDVNQKNPKGNNYEFKTDKKFIPINLCSNESAVEYCKKNNVLIYYNDFLNGGKLRVLSEYTPETNRNMKNPYLYRSSNIANL